MYRTHARTVHTHPHAFYPVELIKKTAGEAGVVGGEKQEAKRGILVPP